MHTNPIEIKQKYHKNEIFPFQLGRFSCWAIFDGNYEGGTAASLFSNAPKKQLENELARYNIGRKNIHLPCTCLLVDTGAQKVLLDTGYGLVSEANKYANNAGRLLGNLEHMGTAAEDIDSVILTHCDGDHIGGTIDEAGRPRYPNAKYFISRAEWADWQEKIAKIALPKVHSTFITSHLLNLEAAAVLVDDQQEIAPGITAVYSPGHSAGHLTLEIESEGEKLLYIADTICHQLHIDHPAWRMSFEHDPAQAVRSRSKIFENADDADCLVLAFHQPFPALGRIRKQGDVYSWVPV